MAKQPLGQKYHFYSSGNKSDYYLIRNCEKYFLMGKIFTQ
jgi:hypothetical protein